MTDAIVGGAGSLVSEKPSAANASLSKLSEDYERFLNLLTAQIQYQDPLEPMDSTQFVTQLAQLSQVEQAVATNDNLESLSTQLNSLVSVAGADLVGRDVTIASESFSLESGETDAFYRVSEGTTSLTAEILDADGNVVRTLSDLSTDSSALQPLAWDGLDDAGGAVLDGDYFVRLSAVDAENAPLSAYSYRTARVQEVLFAEGSNYFNLDSGQQVSADAILSAS